jgi:hypothetical protein
MYRKQLQHVILEIGRRFGIKDVYVIGSAAILAVLPNPPEGELTATRVVDVIPPQDDERLADQISFVLGEASDFELAYGYFAQGVTSKTPTFAPRDWKSRTISIHVDGCIGRCVSPEDLILGKLGAGREKDLPFARAAAKLGLVQRDKLIELLGSIDSSEEQRKRIATRIDAMFQ